jgi:hypothetical protein
LPQLLCRQSLIASTVSRAFSLLLCTGGCGEVRLFLRKSRHGSRYSVSTRSENAVAGLNSYHRVIRVHTSEGDGSSLFLSLLTRGADTLGSATRKPAQSRVSAGKLLCPTATIPGCGWRYCPASSFPQSAARRHSSRSQADLPDTHGSTPDSAPCRPRSQSGPVRAAMAGRVHQATTAVAMAEQDHRAAIAGVELAPYNR